MRFNFPFDMPWYQMIVTTQDEEQRLILKAPTNAHWECSFCHQQFGPEDVKAHDARLWLIPEDGSFGPHHVDCYFEARYGWEA